ncbi:flagellar biosynthesis protein FlhF [Haloimpatiens lingqiaonensis]|uniref:flagellar biosynthesis protein FlhF n=1 Tax=Haloimpatiens lingqiaonensis TaxID=1380675 RepID=UPI0010FDB9B7|nr:flagellar biosynthesis protein FlhF [Haloimpatiens lingqiaonensis]
MKVKKFIVKDMNEALAKIRYELGEEAVIINQTKVRQPGIKGFFSKKLIQVTAATESQKDKRDIKLNSNDDLLINSLELIKNAVNYAEVEEKIHPTEKKEVSGEKFYRDIKNDYNEKTYVIKNQEEKETMETNKLLEEMNEMKILLNNFINKTKDKDEEEADPLYERLRILDLEPLLMKSIVEEFNSIEEELPLEQKLKKVLEDKVTIYNGDMEGPVVFVGPTGVGKTTTIAKLAGRLSLIENKKVGLVTVDTYRIGAVEQLKTYAEIMDIPFKVVFNINDMEEAIKSMENCDVVLIDTTGRSSKNSMQLSQLRAFVDKVNTENINLVISATTKNDDISTIVEGYKKLNFNHIIITKLDETVSYGSILNIVYHGNKDINFVTTGQNVPDDIKKLDSSSICRLVLGEDNIC